MFKARKKVEIKKKARDIIEEYAHYGSTVYAPITRDGLSLDKKANKYEVQPEALSSYQGLSELHQMLVTKKPFVFDMKVNVDKTRENYRKSLTRKDVQHKAALEKAHKRIEKLTQEKDQTEKLDAHDPIQQMECRPETPNYIEEGAKNPTEKQVVDKVKEERAIRATILLQRLLRGRAQQNMMFEGKEKRLDLITELRATEEIRNNSEN